MVSKYKEKIDSDSRQIRQLDIERNEAELAKNKFQVGSRVVAGLSVLTSTLQHQNNVLAAALDIAQKDVEVYTKALMEKETEFSKYRTDSVSMLGSQCERQLTIQSVSRAAKSNVREGSGISSSSSGRVV